MNIKQMIIHFTEKSRSRAFRSINRDPIKELASLKMQVEFDSVVLYALVDALDNTGNLSKETLEELIEKRLNDFEAAATMMEAAMQIMDGMPQSERDKVYNDVVSSIMNEDGTNDSKQRPL